MKGSSINIENRIKALSGKLTEEVNVFWFRRDLRLYDNTGLYYALKSGKPVVLLFLFDDMILEDLPDNDPRVSFIYNKLSGINKKLSEYRSSLLIFKGDSEYIWKKLPSVMKISTVFWNNDYEPYATKRDEKVAGILKEKGISSIACKDQVIFEKGEVTKDDSSPYTVFTPYSKKWIKELDVNGIPGVKKSENHLDKLAEISFDFPSIESMSFRKSKIEPREFEADNIKDYDKQRDYPYLDATSFAGPHLRFGTRSIREIVKTAMLVNKTYLNELIWREFFMQILYHYPKVVNNSFREKYDNIRWINDEDQFDKWCRGLTGYPIVDAGMRQLNNMGYMHNRVRMITASFLCKHLLIDWRWGEKYFASKLLDYELSSNNGNWQWAAGTGCDAAPYFRVFNPTIQAKKFDKNSKYINKWIPEINSPEYPKPIVEHAAARNRAIETYRYYLDGK